MSTKITKCDKCNSKDIDEVNPKVRETSKDILCNIICVCNDCKYEFVIKSWTNYGKRRGVLY